MTTPVAIVPTTYDSTDLQAADLITFLQIVRGLWESPAVRGTDTLVPGRDGQYPGAREVDHTDLELYGWCRADPDASDHDAAVASFHTALAALRVLFYTQRDRATLTAGLADGTVLEIEARPTSLIINEVVPGYFAYVSVQLLGDGDWAAAS